jgi:hypothetical protein
MSLHFLIRKPPFHVYYTRLSKYDISAYGYAYFFLEKGTISPANKFAGILVLISMKYALFFRDSGIFSFFSFFILTQLPVDEYFPVRNRKTQELFSGTGFPKPAGTF